VIFSEEYEQKTTLSQSPQFSSANLVQINSLPNAKSHCFGH